MPIFPGRRLRKPPPPPPPPPYQPLDVPEGSLEWYSDELFAFLPEEVQGNIIADVKRSLNLAYSANGEIEELATQEEYEELPGMSGLRLSLDPRDWPELPKRFLDTLLDWNDLGAYAEARVWDELTGEKGLRLRSRDAATGLMGGLDTGALGWDHLAGVPHGVYLRGIARGELQDTYNDLAAQVSTWATMGPVGHRRILEYEKYQQKQLEIFDKLAGRYEAALQKIDPALAATLTSGLEEIKKFDKEATAVKTALEGEAGKMVATHYVRDPVTGYLFKVDRNKDPVSGRTIYTYAESVQVGPAQWHTKGDVVSVAQVGIGKPPIRLATSADVVLSMEETAVTGGMELGRRIERDGLLRAVFSKETLQLPLAGTAKRLDLRGKGLKVRRRRDEVMRVLKGSDAWRNVETHLANRQARLVAGGLSPAQVEELKQEIAYCQDVQRLKNLDRAVTLRELRWRTSDILSTVWDMKVNGLNFRNTFRFFLWAGEAPIRLLQQTFPGHLGDTFKYLLPAYYVGAAVKSVSKFLPAPWKNFVFTDLLGKVSVSQFQNAVGLKGLYELFMISNAGGGQFSSLAGRAIFPAEAKKLMTALGTTFVENWGGTLAIFSQLRKRGVTDITGVLRAAEVLATPGALVTRQGKAALRLLRIHGLDVTQAKSLASLTKLLAKLKLKKKVGLLTFLGKWGDHMRSWVFKKLGELAVTKLGLKVVGRILKEGLTAVITGAIAGATAGAGVVLEPVVRVVVEAISWLIQRYVLEAVKKVFGKAKDTFESAITFGTGERVGITGSLIEHLMWTGGAATATPFIAGCGCLFLIFIFPILILGGVHGPIARDLGTPLEVGGGFFEPVEAALAGLGVQVVVEADPYNVPEGETPSITYTINITNYSSEIATNVSLEDLNFGRGAIAIGSIAAGGSQAVVWSDVLIDSPSFSSSCPGDPTQFCNQVRLTAFVGSDSLGDVATGVVWLGVEGEEFPSGWPLNSACITQGPGGSYSHSGVDAIDFGWRHNYGDNLGDPVYATHVGAVERVRYGTVGYGYYVMVRSPLGFATIYTHLLSISVTEGQSVGRGAVLGTVNDTGNSTSPHLHYELVEGGGITLTPPYIPVSVPACSGRGDCASMMGSEQCF